MSIRAHERNPKTHALTVAERRALVAELPVVLRRMYRRVLVTTLREGVPVDASATVIVLSALDESYDDPMCFTAERVEELAWVHIGSFCAANMLAAPSQWDRALFSIMALAVADPSMGCDVEDPREVFHTLSQLTSSGIRA